LNKEKIQLLGKRKEKLLNENKSLNNRYQELTGKGEDEKRLLFELSEENTQEKSEPPNLKSGILQDKGTRGSGATLMQMFINYGMLLLQPSLSTK